MIQDWDSLLHEYIRNVDINKKREVNNNTDKRLTYIGIIILKSKLNFIELYITKLFYKQYN